MYNWRFAVSVLVIMEASNLLLCGMSFLIFDGVLYFYLHFALELLGSGSAVLRLHNHFGDRKGMDPKLFLTTVCTTTTLHSFNGLFSRTAWVSRHQKSRTILVKPIWIYWSKRQWVSEASAGPYANLHLAPDIQLCQHPTTQFLLLFVTSELPVIEVVEPYG